MWVAFAMQQLLTFFSKNVSVYAIFNDQSFNDTLTNDIVSFEQLGPEVYVTEVTLPHPNTYQYFICNVIPRARNASTLMRRCIKKSHVPAGQYIRILWQSAVFFFK